MSTLQPSFSAPEFYMTAEHDVRSRAYEVTCLMSDIVYSEGINNTQIRMRPLAGYTLQDATTVGVAAVLLSQGINFEVLWQASLKNLTAEAIMMGNEMGVFLRVDRLEQVFLRFIKSKSQAAVNEAFIALPANYHTGGAFNALQKATAAQGRLLAVTPGSTFMSKEQWEMKLAKVSAIIGQIEEELRALTEFNREKDVLRKEAKNVRDSYISSLEATEQTDRLPSLFQAYMVTIHSIYNTEFRMREIGKGYITNHSQLLREVELLCPAEKN